MPPIGSSTEAREAQVAWSIFERGDWILPLRNGLVPSKPMLYHWCSAFLALLCGSHEIWQLRLVSLLFSAGVLVLCLSLAWRWSRGSLAVCMISGMLLSLTYGFSVLVVQIRVDMAFAFFLTLACWSLLHRFSERQICSPSDLLSADFTLFWAASGLAVLARGPLGVVLPVVILLGVFWSEWGPRRAFLAMLRPQIGWLFFLLLAVPWYVLAMQQAGDAFVSRQLVFENLQRFLGGQNVNHEPFWFYLPSLLRTALPWSLIFFAGLWALRPGARSSGRSQAGCGERDSLVFRLTALWFLTGFVFFSLSSGKRHSYLLPLYVPLALHVAWQLRRYWETLSDAARGRWLHFMNRSAPAALCLSMALVVEVLRLVAASSGPLWLEAGQWLTPWFVRAELFFCLAAGGLWFAERKCRGQALGSLFAIWFSLHAVLATVIITGAALKNHFKGYEGMASAINASSGKQHLDVLLAEREEIFDVLLYYLKREVNLKPPLAQSLDCGRFSLTHSGWYNSLRVEAEAQGIAVQETGRFYQPYRLSRGEKDQAIVLFKCVR